MTTTLSIKTTILALAALLLASCGQEPTAQMETDSTPLNEAAQDSPEETSASSTVDVEPLSFSPLSTEGDVVEWVELTRYVGQWYEIATTPSQQQQICAGTKAIYAAGENGRINVTNQCNRGSLDGTVQTIDGYAEVVDESTNAKLEVTFFGFGAPYWVIALDGTDTDAPYQWAVVSGPSDTSMWLLSRTPQLSEDNRAAIESHLQERGIDTSSLINTAQPNPLEQ